MRITELLMALSETRLFLPIIPDFLKFLSTNDSLRKLSGFSRSLHSRGELENPFPRDGFYKLKSLFHQFQQLDQDCIFLLSSSSLQWVHLNPFRQLKSLIRKCKLAVFASGTLKPIEDFRYLQSEVGGGISSFECGHVVAADRLVCIPVAGFDCGTYGFEFSRRKDSSQALALGRYLCEVAKVLGKEGKRKGVVVFFQSYQAKKEILGNIVEMGEFVKVKEFCKVFEETEEESAEGLLKKYSDAIFEEKDDELKVCVLFSVVGGKLSEGINFSDDLNFF